MHVSGCLIVRDEPGGDGSRREIAFYQDQEREAATYLSLENTFDNFGFKSLLNYLIKQDEREKFEQEFRNIHSNEPKAKLISKILLEAIENQKVIETTTLINKKNAENKYYLKDMETFHEKILQPMIEKIESDRDILLRNLREVIVSELSRKQAEAHENMVAQCLDDYTPVEACQIQLYKNDLKKIELKALNYALKTFINANFDDISHCLKSTDPSLFEHFGGRLAHREGQKILSCSFGDSESEHLLDFLLYAAVAAAEERGDNQKKALSILKGLKLALKVCENKVRSIKSLYYF